LLHKASFDRVVEESLAQAQLRERLVERVGAAVGTGEDVN